LKIVEIKSFKSIVKLNCNLNRNNTEYRKQLMVQMFCFRQKTGALATYLSIDKLPSEEYKKAREARRVGDPRYQFVSHVNFNFEELDYKHIIERFCKFIRYQMDENRPDDKVTDSTIDVLRKYLLKCSLRKVKPFRSVRDCELVIKRSRHLRSETLNKD